jgi:uncharacterized SAM-binding protein YcdF (DUF218 family)
MSEFGIGQDLIPAANAVAAFLAYDQLRCPPSEHDFDMVVLAGNAILPTAGAAFDAAKAAQVPVLITGGIGHSTALLAKTVAQRHSDIEVHERAEADILRDVAVRFHGLDPDQVLVEPASTNCGENASFTWRYLDERGLRPSVALLVQDPLMQRRTDASFKRVWLDSPWRTAFLSWPTFTPRLEWINGEVIYEARLPRPLWSGRRFMSLLLGEIPRLRNDENGYGPRGKDFIAPVDIPAEIERDFLALAAQFDEAAPALSRQFR